MPNKEEYANLSVAGDRSQMLSLFQKIGSAIFAIGIVGIYFIYDAKKENQYFAAVIAFGIQLVGAFLFTYQGGKFSVKSDGRNYFSPLKIIAYIFAGVGVSVLASAWLGLLPEGKNDLYLFLMMVPFTLSIGIFSYALYADHVSGIKNNYVWNSTLSGRGVIGWIVGIILTIFYFEMYWGRNPFPQFIGLFDSLSLMLKGKVADKWFLYGTFYTFVILFLGIKFMIKYRHNRYQLIRTVVVIFSQLVFAYFIPNIMESLQFNGAEAGYYNGNPINSWPLHYNYSSFDVSTLKVYTAEAYQPAGMTYLIWGVLMFLVVTPVVTYFVGKRWYCSWFCGCGGLAETAGDSFRHLSNKSVKAWKIERWVIHSVMVFVLLMTLGAMLPFFMKSEFAIGFLTLNKNFFFITALLLLGGLLFFFARSYKKQTIKNRYLAVAIIIIVMIVIALVMAYFTGTKNAFLIKSTTLKNTYGFFVGSAFSGVIGVGFYPILGNRVWCRFGCPMAGYMGLIQRFKSRFRITTNGGQCISCGNCSTYCEQGIDVRAYAQKGQNIVRASCVGCGVCSAVCPRGVLKLENGPEEGRITDNPILIGKDGIRLAEFDKM